MTLVPDLLFAPNTNQCGLNEYYEIELLQNITKFARWSHLPIYHDLMPIRDIIKSEQNKWALKFGNDSIHEFPKYLVTNHFGSYCAFSRAFFPLFFETAASFGIESATFVLLESKSPWYFSTRKSVTGIPDIRLYQIENDKATLMGQYITSGPRSYEGFSYWLNKYTKAERDKYPLLIPPPILHKESSRNRKYYQEHYEPFRASAFDTVNGSTFELDRFVQMTAILEDELLAKISAVLTIGLIVVTVIKWIIKCYQRVNR